MSENRTPSTDLHRDFCAGIGPLQLGVVLVLLIFNPLERVLEKEHMSNKELVVTGSYSPLHSLKVSMRSPLRRLNSRDGIFKNFSLSS